MVFLEKLKVFNKGSLNEFGEKKVNSNNFKIIKCNIKEVSYYTKIKLSNSLSNTDITDISLEIVTKELLMKNQEIEYKGKRYTIKAIIEEKSMYEALKRYKVYA